MRNAESTDTTMALKFKVKSKEEIPAEHLPLYTERDGGWVLDVEGATDKSRVDELRQQNTELRRKMEEHTARYEGIDPDEVRRLVEEKRRLELEAQGHQPEEFERVVADRVKGLRADWEKQVAVLAGERDALTARLTAIQIDQGVVTAATRRGLRPTAIPDITARARMVFRLVQGVPRAFEADGQTVRYGRDGVTPMSLEEWVDAQTSDAPHLFEANAGGGSAGAPGGTAAGAGRVKNPFRKETWNLTEQMRLQKSDPGLAARLKAAT